VIVRRHVVCFLAILFSAVLLKGATAGSSVAEQNRGNVSGSEYFVPPPLEPQLSSDGQSMYHGVAPVVYVADPNPPKEQLRVLPPRDLVELSESATATFSITYIPNGGADLWGEPCFTFPESAKAAFNAAASVWGAQVKSSVPITIEACWANLLSDTTLGYSGGGTLHRNFTNAPRANTWYSSSLANSFAGYDLNPSNADMHITYNQNFTWYLGTDGNTPGGQYDFMSVVLHEICHGLNFSGSMTYSGGLGSWGYGTGYPNIYDTFMKDGSGNLLINTSVYPNSSTALGSALTSNNVWFQGSFAMSANGGSSVKIYAPITWDGGSSYSHLDYAAFSGTVNRLMVYAISSGVSTHDPGPVAKGLLQDLGWSVSVLGPPGQATLISPSGKITTRTPTYTWYAVSNSTVYILYVKDSGGNTINNSYTAEQVGCSSGAGTCSVNPGFVLAPGPAKWWVQTWNTGGYGPWSAPLDFTAPPPPPGKANLISPSGTINTTEPTYQWNAVTYATHYCLWVKDSTGKRMDQWYTDAQVGCSGGTGVCSLWSDTCLTQGAGKWWIQAWNESGYGSWGDGMDFTVAPVLGKPLLTGPSATVYDATPTCLWKSVDSATWYRLSVYASTGPLFTKWYSAEDAACSGGGDCSVTPEVALAKGDKEWWVQPWKADYIYGPWSDGMAFTVGPEPGKAVLVSPSGAAGLKPTYTWNAVLNSTWYYLYVNDSMGKRIDKWYTAAQTGCSSGTGVCEVKPDTALALGAGKWWIQTWNEVGYGPWSDGIDITVADIPDKAILISPEGDIGSQPTYTWNAVSKATWYYLWVNDSTGKRIDKWYTASEVGCPSGTGACSVKPDTVLALGGGKWWIQTWNTAGYGPWSDGMEFVVDLASELSE
jgi:hypothetical protein